MILLSDYVQGTGTESIVLALKAALQVRNARETEPFEGVYKSYERLRKAGLKLRMTVMQQDKKIILLRGNQMDGETLKSVQEDLLKLTSEMYGGMERRQRAEESAGEQLRLMKEADELRQQLGIVCERLEKLQVKHGESLTHTASAEAEAKLSGVSEERLKLELVSLRNLLVVAENDAEMARNDRDHLLKTIKEKQSMVDQINDLNDEVNNLKGSGTETNKRHDRQPKLWRPHWKKYSSPIIDPNHSYEDEKSRTINEDKKNLAAAPTTAGPPVPNRCLTTFVHTEGQRVNDCAYSESLLSTASDDGTICIWYHSGIRGFQAKIRSSNSDSLPPARSNAIPLCCIVVGDILMGGCSDNTIKLWNYKTSRHLGKLTGHHQRVSCLTSLGCLGGGPYVASGSHDCSIKIFDVATGKNVNKIIMRAKSKCTGLAAADGSSSFVSGHMDGSLRFWDPRTCSRVHSISALHAGHISGLDIAQKYGSSTLLTCGRDNKLKVFDMRTYTLIGTLSHGSFIVGHHCGKPAISSDGRLAVAGSASGVVYVWDVSSKRVIAQLESHETPVVACSWSSTISQLASCDTSGNVVIWG